MFANKQDLPNAMQVSEISEKLGLVNIRNRKVSHTDIVPMNTDLVYSVCRFQYICYMYWGWSALHSTSNPYWMVFTCTVCVCVCVCTCMCVPVSELDVQPQCGSLLKKWSLLSIRLLSYGCLWEVGRAWEKLLSGTRWSRVPRGFTSG